MTHDEGLPWPPVGRPTNLDVLFAHYPVLGELPPFLRSTLGEKLRSLYVPASGFRGVGDHCSSFVLVTSGTIQVYRLGEELESA